MNQLSERGLRARRDGRPLGAAWRAYAFACDSAPLAASAGQKRLYSRPCLVRQVVAVQGGGVIGFHDGGFYKIISRHTSEIS